MSCRGKRATGTKGSLLNQNIAIVEDEHRKQTVTYDENFKENMLQSSKQISSNKSKGRKVFSSCKLCRGNKSIPVANLTSSLDGSNPTCYKQATDNKAEADISNMMQSSGVYFEVNTGNPVQAMFSSISDNKNNSVEVPVEKKYMAKVSAKHGNEEEAIQLDIKDHTASLETVTPVTYTDGVSTLYSQPTVEEESDLIVNANEERKRNKKRVRAKTITKITHLSPLEAMDKLEFAYWNAQKEINKILEPQYNDTTKEIKSLPRNKGERKDILEDSKNKIKSKSLQKTSLDKARQNMHMLLDDAFDVFSHKKFTLLKKVEHSKQNSDGLNPCHSQGDYLPRAQKVAQPNVTPIHHMVSEKMHKPIEVHSPQFRNQVGLIMQNPYKTFDDVMLLSSLNTEVTSIGTPFRQENITTSLFEQVINPRKYFTIEPGEPIIIKTKHLEHKMPQADLQRKESSRKYSFSFDSNEKPSLNTA